MTGDGSVSFDHRNTESTVIGAGDFVSAGLWNLFDALALIQKSAAVAPRPLQVQLSSA